MSVENEIRCMIFVSYTSTSLLSAAKSEFASGKMFFGVFNFNFQFQSLCIIFRFRVTFLLRKGG